MTTTPDPRTCPLCSAAVGEYAHAILKASKGSEIAEVVGYWCPRVATGAPQ